MNRNDEYWNLWYLKKLKSLNENIFKRNKNIISSEIDNNNKYL